MVRPIYPYPRLMKKKLGMVSSEDFLQLFPANKENLAPMKGEAPLEELTTVTKGEQNTVEEVRIRKTLNGN